MAATATQDIPSAADIRVRVCSNLCQIQNLEYKGKLTGSVNSRSGQENAHFRHFKGQLGSRYLETHHEMVPGIPASWDLNHRIQMYRPGFMEAFSAFGRLSEVSAKHADPLLNHKLKNLYHDFYIVAIGWIPEWLTEEDNLEAIRAVPIQLLNEPGDTIQVTQEFRESLLCWCLTSTSGKDGSVKKLWVCPNLNYAIVGSEEVFSSESSQTSYVYRKCYALRDFRPVGSSGVMLPYIVEREFVRSADAHEKEVLTDGVLVIDELSVNTLNDEAFKIDRPPGTIVRDGDAGTHSTLTGGFEIAENSIDLARYLTAVHNDRLDASRRRRIPISILLCILAIALLGTVSTTYMIRKIRSVDFDR